MNPLPVAVEGMRCEKVPWMRSFWVRELGALVGNEKKRFSDGDEGMRERIYIVGGLGSHTTLSENN